MNTVIAISRQYASAGRTIGHQLADKLGIPCYDSSILDKISEKTGLDQKYIKESGEYSTSTSWIFSAIAGRDYNGRTLQDDIWQVQRETIMELAGKEDCVIIGRNADYLLKDMAQVISVFIHASEEERIQRAIYEYREISESEDARRIIRQRDKRRKAYTQMYTEIQWGEARYYDVCLDSGKFGVELCVEILAQLYRSRAGK